MQLSKKHLQITGMQGKNKHGDSIFLLHFFNVLCMAINCAKFQNKFDSRTISRELPEGDCDKLFVFQQ